MPNDRLLRQTGLSFRRAFCNTSMCSPSRATLLTGQYPAQHGVTLTHTRADLRPDPRNAAAVTGTLVDILRTPNAPRKRALSPVRTRPAPARPEVRRRARAAARHPQPRPGPQGGRLRGRLQGQVAPDPPKGDGPLLAGWGAGRCRATARDYGFADWEPPDAGENAKAEHFGAGNAGPLGHGWDELYTRQAEAWLDRPDLPEPFCLVVSLVNPHDVLGYPAQYLGGGYSRSEFRDLDVKLPPTVDEDMRNKPAVHELMRMGMTAYLGPLNGERAKLDYVNFYAHLHRVVDAQVGRLLDALGDPADPGSLRSRTVIFRCADHGEMGLSHGGLRQKAFNAYEETIHVPMVISNPVLFPRPDRDRRPRVADRPDAHDRDDRGRAARRRSAVVTSPRPRRLGAPRAGSSRIALASIRSCAIPLPRPRSRKRSTSPTTTTKPRPRSRTCRVSRTGSALRDREGKVRDLLRSRGKGAQRVRALRPRARSR